MRVYVKECQLLGRRENLKFTVLERHSRLDHIVDLNRVLSAFGKRVQLLVRDTHEQMLDMLPIVNLDFVVIDVCLATQQTKLDRLKPFADFFSLCTFLTTFQIVLIAWKYGEANKFVLRYVVGVHKFSIPLVSHRK